MEYIPDTFPAEVHHYSGIHAGNTVKKYCQGHFLFIFVRGGFLGAVIDGTKVSCTSNELVIAICRNYYQVIKYNKKVTCYLVKVQWQFITDIKMSSHFINLLVSKHILKIFPDSFDSKVLSRIMKLLHYYYLSVRNPVRFPLASFNAALSLLIYQAAWQQDENLDTKGKSYTRKEMLAMQFLKLLIQHYREENNITFYAQQLFVTKQHLNKTVREVTGRTVGKCISEIIISEAKYLLLSTELSVESISEQLHFNSVGSFRRFFKKETALTPAEYRRGDF